jgi:hypothetical protein
MIKSLIPKEYVPEYSIANRPTLRRNGYQAYNMSVTHAIFIEDIAWAIYAIFDNKIMGSTGKKDILDAVAFKLLGGGTSEDIWDDVSSEEIDEAMRLAGNLFPELKEKIKEK